MKVRVVAPSRWHANVVRWFARLMRVPVDLHYTSFR